jgi:hypothetical protein
VDDLYLPEKATLIHQLIGHWSQLGVHIRPGAPPESVEFFETRYHVRLPADLRAYFTAVDGMIPGEADPDGFSFLPLHAVKSIPEELAHWGGTPDYRDIMRSLLDPSHWFVIVDYLICSAVYAIRLSPRSESTPVLWIGDGTRHRVAASSFTTFVQAYLVNPFELL